MRQGRSNMAKYRPDEMMKAVFKMVAGIMVAYFLWSVFDSFFLGFLAFTFLFFIPIQDESSEMEINSVLFTVLMIILVMLAFWNKEIFGLGLDFGITLDTIHYFLIGGFLVFIGLRSVLFSGIRPGGGSIASEDSVFIRGLLTFGAVAVLIFMLLMPIQYGGLEPWNWNAETVIFMGIWLLGFISGSLSSDLSSRQVFGAIIIVVAFVIFSMGAGTQQVGTAFFGEWWPNVYEFGESTLKPMGEQFSQLTEGLTMAIQLITNPTGFAQRIMNGTYQTDPTTGLKGAYGVEIENFKTTPIYVGQPFSISFNLNNKGAFEATSVRAGIAVSSEDAPTETIQELGVPTGTLRFMNIFNLGFNRSYFLPGNCTTEKIGSKERTDCWSWVDGNASNVFTKLDIRPVFFASTEGIGCSAYNAFIQQAAGTRKAIPLVGFTEYNYEIESNLQIEFIKADEWTRRVTGGEGLIQQKKASTLSNAPVQLNLDTLDQPIREGTSFYLALQLAPGPRGGKISGSDTIILEVPNALGLDRNDCSVKSDKEEVRGNTTRFIWYGIKEPYLIYCQPLSYRPNNPTETFQIRAYANYTFKKWDTTLATVDFAAGCCKSSDCPTGQVCVRTDPEKPGQCRDKSSTQNCHDLTKKEDCEKYNHCTWNVPPWTTAGICLNKA